MIIANILSLFFSLSLSISPFPHPQGLLKVEKGEDEKESRL